MDNYKYNEMNFDDWGSKTDYKLTLVNGIKLPCDYLEFIHEHNGGEGFILENLYINLFSLEELEQANVEYDVQKYWPNCVAFGTDGGGMLLCFDIIKQMYCEIDACNIGEDSKIFYGSISFLGFLKKMDEVRI